MDIISTVFTFGFMIGFQILFFLSVRLCFGTESKRGIRLFILTLIANPLICYIEAMALTSWALQSFMGGLWDYIKALGSKDIRAIAIYTGIIEVVYCLLIALYILWMEKWLKVKNKSQLLFLYFMFSAICVIYMRDNGSSTELADNYVYIMIDIVGTTLLFIACLIFYRLDVRTLSKLSLEQVDVKWRMFLIPPAVFTILYSTGSTAQMIQYLDNSLGYNKDTVIAIFTFSTIIVYLLIWAFYVIIKNLNAASEIKTLSVEVMEALAHTIDAKDEYTRGHSVRVAKYSRMIAQKLGMSPVECENVYYMGLLHDLGKIGVPNEIINSPNKLTDEEYKVIKTHPGLGYDILSEMKSRPDLAIGARWHHERYDGKGYPDGKAGEDIPLYARIIAVADSYDAMTSNRSYRKYMPQQAVRSEIEKNSGTQFDPRFAACMIDIIDEDTEYVLHE